MQSLPSYTIAIKLTKFGQRKKKHITHLSSNCCSSYHMGLKTLLPWFPFPTCSASIIHFSVALSLAFYLSIDVHIVGGRPLKTLLDSPLSTDKISSNNTILVDINGGGDFKSVQDAIDSVPNGNSKWVIIHVRKGKYREKVQIPKSKPNIFLRGSGRENTFILWSQSSADNVESATFKVEASNFVAFGISFRNDAPTGVACTSQNQSVAAFVAADRVAFYHCGFYSTHNTLFDYEGKHYFDSCYIQGSVDSIFGRARSYFLNCEIFVVADKRVQIHGSIAAQSRESGDEESGFVFVKGEVYGIGRVYLGRAKTSHSRVIFAQTYFSTTITPEGWTNWSYDGSTQNLYLAEYKCRGPGSITLKRAPWTKMLTDLEAAPFLSVDFVEGKQWLPVRL